VILLIDNYDSFVHNLARYFRRLGQETVVVRNDAIGPDDVPGLQPSAIVLSPGPCTPLQAGCSLDLVGRFHGTIPMLGVCLGHQAIAAALGACIVRAPEPMHGRVSPVFHDGQDVFAGLPNPLRACRYHSLVVKESTLPSCLVVSARTADGVVMAIRHRDRPLVGLQFHPESILTSHGYEILAAFLRRGGISVPEVLPGMDNEGQEQERGRGHDSRRSGDNDQRRQNAEHLADGPAGRCGDAPVCAPPLPNI
jgi:anthranilate synthase/aminodeoxychorismate synthase-like glutamine amidotransferase